MKQVIVIHGGTTYSEYDDYFRDLTTKPVSIERLVPFQSWKDRLQGDIGSDYQVLLPSMPNKTNARYEEWAMWFSRITEVLVDDCILIGHSLGGIFLAKYLSENSLPIKVNATILIAAPYDDESSEDLTDFKIKQLSPRFTEQAGHLTFFFGENDPVIPLSEMQSYKQAVPDATYHSVDAPDHFVRHEFPLLVKTIQSLDSLRNPYAASS